LQTDKDNFCLALLLGTLGGFLLSLIFTEGFPLPEGTRDAGHIYHYQALIAGGIASIAAGATVLAILHQIKQQERHRKTHLIKKLFVYRSYMPDALTELTRIMESYFEYLERSELKYKTENIPWEAPQEPIKIFKDSLEYTEGETAEHIIKMISFYQMHSARVYSLFNKIYTHMNDAYHLEDAMYDTIVLNSYINRLYEYSRFKKDKVENRDSTKREMLNSLNELTGWRASYPEYEWRKNLKTRIEKYH